MKDIEFYSKELEIKLDKDQLQKFADYEKILLWHNKVTNLTRITESSEIALKHFADSLAVIPFINKYLPKDGKGQNEFQLIDVGTGAGFPGIPIKIALPWINVTLLDSLNKRISFLDNVIAELKLNGIKTIHSRAEDAGRIESFRDSFDVVIARAVASLPLLVEYCLPLVRPGGIFLGMKSDCEQEVSQSKYAIDLLGGKIEEVCEYTLNNGQLYRTIVVIRKLKSTPKEYPRKAGKASTKPLIKE